MTCFLNSHALSHCLHVLALHNYQNGYVCAINMTRGSSISILGTASIKYKISCQPLFLLNLVYIPLVVSPLAVLGFNVETVEFTNISFTVWDVSGQDNV